MTNFNSDVCDSYPVPSVSVGGSQHNSPSDANRSKGGAAELETLLQHHLPLVTAVVRRYLWSETDVLDVVQETALQAIACFHQFRSEASFGTWLVRIAINEARQLIRQQKYCRLTDSLDQTNQQLPHRQVSPEEEVQQAEKIVSVRLAVQKLPSIYRTVLQVCELEEHSIKQAAQLLDITMVAAKSRRFRGRHLLKKQLLRSAARNNKSGLNVSTE